MSRSPLPIIRDLVSLFDEEGNLVGDYTQIQSVVNSAYITLSAYSLAKDGRDLVARALWHRFASESVIEWDDETYKAEYLDAADEVIQICSDSR